MRNVYRILVGEAEGKRPLIRPKHRWEDNIKMDRKTDFSHLGFSLLSSVPMGGCCGSVP
jgi:hypothetical protein